MNHYYVYTKRDKFELEKYGKLWIPKMICDWVGLETNKTKEFLLNIDGVYKVEESLEGTYYTVDV